MHACVSWCVCLYFGVPKCSCMQVKSVFLDGLPASWDETDVYEHFKKYGEIENVQLARNMPTAKRKDFGFIGFRTREAAMACIDDVNEKGIGEGTHKVLLSLYCVYNAVVISCF